MIGFVKLLVFAAFVVVTVVADGPYYPKQPAYPSYPAYPKSYDHVYTLF